MKKLNQTGSHLVAVALLIAVVAAVGLVGWRVLSKDKTSTSTEVSGDFAGSESEVPPELIWRQTENGWQSSDTPPTCTDQPMMTVPADITKVTSILYPGQTRGGNYKPHGGFRFDDAKDNKVNVTAPIDGFIVRGGRYLAEGEVQYTFDVFNNCGVMYRVGHLRELAEDLQKIADTWPEPQEGDSRTQSVSPAVYVKRGTALASKVGIISDKNTFFDWGVYDYRQENEASKSAAYQQAHSDDKELAWHGVCWFDWVPASDEATIRSLPAGDPTSGKNSDYCK